MYCMYVLNLKTDIEIHIYLRTDIEMDMPNILKLIKENIMKIRMTL